MGWTVPSCTLPSLALSSKKKFWDFLLPRVKFDGKEILLEGWELLILESAVNYNQQVIYLTSPIVRCTMLIVHFDMNEQQCLYL